MLVAGSGGPVREAIGWRCCQTDEHGVTDGEYMEIWPGSPYPLGATFDGAGTNFAIFSEAAERVELCLVDVDGSEQRFEMSEVDGFVWHCHLPRIGPGQR